MQEMSNSFGPVQNVTIFPIIFQAPVQLKSSNVP